jgi:phosphohistidine phosphatase SixA
MRRELILLRHAHAEPAAPGQDDRERPLSARGVREAQAAGAWLRAHGALPARLLCSPALRARQTLTHALGAVEPAIEPEIFAATAGALVALIDDQPTAERLLLVGHNPGLETLLALLTTGQSGEFRGLPPAGIAWLELDGRPEPGTGRLKAFWSP